MQPYFRSTIMKSSSYIIRVMSLLALTLTSLISCTDRTYVIWSEGVTDSVSGRAVHTVTVVNPPKGNDWVVWFAANHIEPDVLEGSQATMRRYNGCMYLIEPTCECKDSMVVRYREKPIPRRCWAPEGFSLQTPAMKRQLRTEYEFLPAEDVEDFSYEKVCLDVADMIPALKRVERIGDGTTVMPPVDEVMGDAEVVSSDRKGWYRIVIDGACRIEASDEDGLYYARVTIENLLRNAGSNVLPDMVVEDWPDLQYRGFMLDVSRNFTGKEGVLKLIDLLSHYKVNALHLHLGDDEGWRLEIDGIPELTGIGAYKSLPEMDGNGNFVERDFLMPSFSGKIDPRSDDNTGNGFYSHKDFIEILRYAWERRMRVIPEFDSPGHARAAIKAMEAYAERTGDVSMLLSEPADTSRYVSVQYYTDNALNVALPSTYNFFAKVFSAVKAYYEEAGVPLEQINIGGDEVPDGAWLGSPACRALMAENGWDDTVMLKSYFVSRLAALALENGMKICGWQELLTGVSEDTREDLLNGKIGNVYYWNTRERGRKDELPYEYANRGADVILSNMTNAYIDFAYNRSKLERGHSWGGFVDERRSFCLLPYDIYRSVRWDDRGRIRDISSLPEGKTELKEPQNIIGVQGQLWSETIRSFDHVTSYIFPKAVGLFERGWNARPVWEGTKTSDDPLFLADFNRFYSIIVEREMPYYESEGIAYRKRKE